MKIISTKDEVEGGKKYVRRMTYHEDIIEEKHFSLMLARLL